MKKMTIRKSTYKDLETIMELFEDAKKIMRANGNTEQWSDGYPSREIAAKDIDNGNSYVCCNENGVVIATFAFIIGADPTYARIYDGSWIDDTLPYGTIHRLASTASSHGIASEVIHWCFERIPNLRADTHSDNRILQHILPREGFRFCGIIHLADGSPRLAYQKI